MINLGKKETIYEPQGISSSTRTSGKRKTVVRYPSFNVEGILLSLSPEDVGKIISATIMLKINKATAEIEEYGTNTGKKISRYSFSIIGLDLKKKKVDVKNSSKEDLDSQEEQEYNRMSLIPKRGG